MYVGLVTHVCMDFRGSELQLVMWSMSKGQSDQDKEEEDDDSVHSVSNGQLIVCVCLYTRLFTVPLSCLYSLCQQSTYQVDMQLTVTVRSLHLQQPSVTSEVYLSAKTQRQVLATARQN